MISENFSPVALAPRLNDEDYISFWQLEVIIKKRKEMLTKSLV
jgi:hypothetical protein